jgi:TonB family protein
MEPGIPAARETSRESTPPIYPQQALRDKVEGFVIVEFNVEADGQVTDPKVIEASPEGVFDDSAVEAIKYSKFEPSNSRYEGHKIKLYFSFSQ